MLSKCCPCTLLFLTQIIFSSTWLMKHQQSVYTHRTSLNMLSSPQTFLIYLSYWYFYLKQSQFVYILYLGSFQTKLYQGKHTKGICERRAGWRMKIRPIDCLERLHLLYTVSFICRRCARVMMSFNHVVRPIQRMYCMLLCERV